MLRDDGLEIYDHALTRTTIQQPYLAQNMFHKQE